jgi:PIN domain nuclease of toxin-antitoxin system
MKKIKTIVLGVILICVSYIIWLIVPHLWNIFNGLQKEVAAAIIAASSTILVSVLSLTIGKYYEKKRTIELEIRNKKIPMYEEFVDFLFKLLMNRKLTGKDLNEKEMLQFFVSFTQKLLVWGSDEVVTHWSVYRKLLVKVQEGTVDTKSSMIQLEKLLYAIRKDTGHKNKKFNRGDILGLFINDVDKIF